MSVADITEFSALDLARRIRSRELAAVEVLDAYLQRIDAINPTLNALVTVAEESARESAEALDRLAEAGRFMGPLHGLPIGIKDLVRTKGIRTTRGSPIYADAVPDTDALHVQRIKASGGVIIGKTNTPEFGAGSHTFNAVFGATRNPYHLDRTCGGSSGGSAVALASRMVALADGSDMGGSLRNPAGYCNVVGFRPSVGAVARSPSPLIYDALSVDGPMARSVEDLHLLFSSMRGAHPHDPLSHGDPGTAVPLREPGRARIAWSPDLGQYEVEPEVVRLCESALAHFDERFTIDTAHPDLKEADLVFHNARAFGFAAKYSHEYGHHRALLKDTVIWNIEQGMALDGSDLRETELARSRLMTKVYQFFDQYDYLVCPTAQVKAFPIETDWVREINARPMATYIDWMGLCYAITVTGCPAISVPAGITEEGTPVGLQIVGRPRDDDSVLAIALAYQRQARFTERQPPRLD